MADGSYLAPDLRKRIEIMADHIARNGTDFEATVKQKNASNPQFAFLYNGEGSEYYYQVLAKQRGTQVLSAPKASAQQPPQPPQPPQPYQLHQPTQVSQVPTGNSLSSLLRGKANQSVGAPGGGSLANLLRSGQVNPTPQATQPTLPRPVQPMPQIPSPMPIPVPQQSMYLGMGLALNQGQVPMALRQEVRPSGFQATPMRIGVPPGPQTPETVPVGILSNMLGTTSKNIRYKPLDPAFTPQTLPFEVPSAHLLARVEEFYDELRDEERDSSSSSSSRSRSRGRENKDSKDFSGRSGFGGFGVMSAVPPPF